MRLQFRHQKFQSDAANAKCEVFNGQPFHAPTYMIDLVWGQIGLEDARSFTGFNNAPVVNGDDKFLRIS
jgi:type III restriction enzyme